METPSNPLMPKKRFRAGGLTYYYRLGKLQVCNSKRPSLKAKKKDEDGNIIPSRTPKQQKNSTKFQGARKLFAAYRRRTHNLPIWKIAAEKLGMTADNLLHHTNYKYLGPDGGILDIEEFKVSVGGLALPFNMKATREGKRITLTWTDDRNDTESAPTDKLMVAILYKEPRRRYGLTFFDKTESTRGDGHAVIYLPKSGGGDICVHPFFAREDLSAFSDDKHFMLPEEN